MTLLDDNNSLIAELLQAYLDLTAQQAAQVMTDAQLVNGALNSSVVGAGANPAPGGVQQPTQTNTGGDTSVVIDVLAAVADITQQASKTNDEKLDDIFRELRRLNTTLTAQVAA